MISDIRKVLQTELDGKAVLNACCTAPNAWRNVYYQYQYTQSGINYPPLGKGGLYNYIPALQEKQSRTQSLVKKKNVDKIYKLTLRIGSSNVSPCTKCMYAYAKCVLCDCMCMYACVCMCFCACARVCVRTKKIAAPHCHSRKERMYATGHIYNTAPK